MKQQVMVAPKQIEFREVPVPELQAGQVLVKIKRLVSAAVTFMYITVRTHLQGIRSPRDMRCPDRS